MIDFYRAYQPLLDLLLLNSGFAFSQYIVLRAGVFSIGTVGFVALGAYLTATATIHYKINLWVMAPVSLVAGLILGLLMSIPLARLRGPYQAIATLAFVQIMGAIALYAENWTGGAAGANNMPAQVGTVGLAIITALVVYFLFSIGATRIGRTFDAIRQDEGVAGALGVNVTYYHAFAFGLSGAIGALYGSLMAAYSYSIEPTQFGFPLLTATLAAVVLGGRRSVFGPIVGAAIMTSLPEIARPLAENRNFVSGLLIALVILFLPSGVVDGLLNVWRRKRMSAKTAQQADGLANDPAN